MKKVVILTAVLAALFSVTAFAGHHGKQYMPHQNVCYTYTENCGSKGLNCVDSNYDGICDNCNFKCTNSSYCTNTSNYSMNNYCGHHSGSYCR